MGLKCFHQVECELNFIKLFPSAKQNQAQLMKSSSLSGPPALSSAKVTLEVARRLVVGPGDTFQTVSCGPTLSLLGDEKAEQAGAWLQESACRCPPAATVFCCESQHGLPTLLASASRTERWTQSGHYILLSGQKLEFLQRVEVHGFIWGWQ